MSKPTIAIDIDDVLADSAKVFIEWSNKKYGTEFTIDDYDEHWAKIWKVDNDEIEKRASEFTNSGIMLTYDCIQSAPDVLMRLKKHYNLVIITSRRTQAKDDTIAWIKKYYPGLFSDIDINFAGMWDKVDECSIHHTKGELSKKLGVDYIIDDQLKHCIAAAKLNIEALLFGDYNWNNNNKLSKGITRVKNWSEVEQYFINKRS